MDLETTAALDPIDGFITAAKEPAVVTAFDGRRFADASAAMSQVALRLLDANQRMAGWLTRFTCVRFDSPQYTEEFRTSVKAWNNAKTGPELHLMKFRCRELFAIYTNRVEPHLAAIFPGDAAIRDQVAQAFESLGGVDGLMVEFIHREIVVAVDTYIEEVDPHVTRSRPNPAERCRLAFARDTAPFLQRLVRFGGELSDLILLYADKAGIEVTDEGSVVGGSA